MFTTAKSETGFHCQVLFQAVLREVSVETEIPEAFGGGLKVGVQSNATPSRAE